MPRNGSGTFNRLYSWEDDAANNIKIRADRMDAEMDGMATALTNSIAVDGQTPITANLPMSGFKHTGVADATEEDEYVAFGQANGQYVRYDESQSLTDTEKAQARANVDAVRLFPGFTILLPDHLTGVSAPDNSGEHKWVKLTAGEDGAGQYNEGLLTNESVTGSAPLVEATADIVGGPMDGQTVHLWNTEGRYPKPGESSGTTANDQMQQITGTISIRRTGDPGGTLDTMLGPTGAFSYSGGTGGDAQRLAEAGASSGRDAMSIDSADSPDARTGTSTDAKHEQQTAYMYIGKVTS